MPHASGRELICFFFAPLFFPPFVNYLVLLIKMHSLRDQILDDVRMSLPGCPRDGTVSQVIQLRQVCSVADEDLDDVQPPEARRDVNGALPVLVALVHVDAPGHGQQLLEALFVALLDRAEHSGQDKVVLLEINRLVANEIIA